MVPSVSIIVPVYNSAKYLTECVESILGQTCKDFELILVDDGSTDGSSAMCDSFTANDSRIRVFHQENAGALAARRHGVEKAEGEWIMFSDSDDVMPADALEHLMSCYDGHAEIVAGTIRYESLGLTIKTDSDDTVHSAENYIALILGRKTYYGPCSKLIRRSLFNGLEWIEDRKVFQNEDLVMLVSLAARVSTYVITDNSWVHYNCVSRPGSVSTRSMSYEGWRKVFESVASQLEQHSMLKNDILGTYLDYVVWSLNLFCINKRMFFPQDSFVKWIVKSVEDGQYENIMDGRHFKLVRSPFLRAVEVCVRRLKFFARKYILK